MALTVSVVHRTVFGNDRVVVADVTFDSSYATGGESLTASDLGFPSGQIFHVSTPATNGANIFAFDHAASKIKAFVTTTGVEVANAVNLATVTVRLKVIGR